MAVIYDPIIFKERSGQAGDEYVIYDNVSYLVTEGKIQLQEIPDFFNKVRIQGLVETLSPNPDPGCFYVNYTDGLVFFNENKNNTTVSVSFVGKGIKFISASRIYTKQENGTIKETLEESVNNIKYMTQDQLDQLNGRVNKTGDTMTGQLNMANENGIMFGGKFRIKYNGTTNTLDISYLGT